MKDWTETPIVQVAFSQEFAKMCRYSLKSERLKQRRYITGGLSGSFRYNKHEVRGFLADLCRGGPFTKDGDVFGGVVGKPFRFCSDPYYSGFELEYNARC